MTDRQEANALIEQYLNEAHEALKKAQAVADEHRLSFNFDVAYGMGGTYEGNPDARDTDYSEDGWVSSSAYC